MQTRPNTNRERITTGMNNLDGIYIVRTDVPHEEMSMDEVVKTYKGLQQVEQAFRNMKSMQLELRPVFHRLEDRVRAHVFLCMLAYYVQWHKRNTVECAGKTFEQVTQPDAYQKKILDALGVVL